MPGERHNFFLSRPVLQEVGDAVAGWVGVVATPFVKIVGQVVHWRVPHSVLIVDEADLRVTESQ